MTNPTATAAPAQYLHGDTDLHGDTVAPPTTRVAHRRPAVWFLFAGCILLVARPPLLGAGGDPVLKLVAVFAALLAVGGLWPFARRVEHHRVAGVLALGVAAFALGRLLGGGDPPFHAPASSLARLILLNSLAAVAEEAFFRRFAYALFLPAGTAVAVAGSAALFALVHVTVYGWWVLPLDLAAGLVLSWQRWASGSWRVPAATHVLANVLVVL